MNRGFSAASPSAARSFLIAVFSPSSNSTKVSLGHSRCRISSRPTSSPGDSRSISSTRKGCSCNLTRSPPLVRTRRPKSASNSPKHAALGLGEVRSISIYLRKTSADCSTTVQNRLQPPLFSLSYLYRSSPEIDPLTQRPVLAISHSSRNSRSDLEAPCLLAPSLRSRLALEPHLCFSLPLPAFSPAVAAVHRALPRAAPSQPSPPPPCPQLLPHCRRRHAAVHRNRERQQRQHHQRRYLHLVQQHHQRRHHQQQRLGHRRRPGHHSDHRFRRRRHQFPGHSHRYRSRRCIHHGFAILSLHCRRRHATVHRHRQGRLRQHHQRCHLHLVQQQHQRRHHRQQRPRHRSSRGLDADHRFRSQRH